MSSRQFEVVVVLKDGGLLKKLDALQSGGLQFKSGSRATESAIFGDFAKISGSRGGSLSGALGNMQTEFNRNLSGALTGMKSGTNTGLQVKGRGPTGASEKGGGILDTLGGASGLLKLTGIGIGIGAMVKLMTKSSGILQGSFKLLETSFMLALKPMADFLGMILRPIAIGLLTQMVIPFYKYVMPWFREWGPKVGDALVNLPQTIIGAISGAGVAINTAFELAGESLQGAWDTFVGNAFSLISDPGASLQKAWDGFTSLLGPTLASVPQMLWGHFVLAGTNIWNTLSQAGNMLWGYFVDVGTNIWNTLSGVGDMVLNVFTGLATSLTEALAGVPAMILEAIQNALSGIPGASDFGSGADRPHGFAQYQTRRRMDMAAVADSLEQ